MANKEETPSIGEVLEVVAAYRAQLVAKHGEQWVRDRPISEQWGDGRTTATLLVKEPGRWERLLDDEGTRRRVHEWILSLPKTLAKA